MLQQASIEYADWIDWLADKWIGNFSHEYETSNSRHWKAHRDTSRSKCWSCNSISDAARQYSWDGRDLQQTRRTLQHLGNELQSSILALNDQTTHTAAIEILKWGGVNRNPTTSWIAGLEKEGKLAEKLSFGLTQLRSNRWDSFDGHHLLMNSAVTKLLSLADSTGKLVIYDGRVGAALGLLVRKFLEEKRLGSIPDELVFAWGDSRPAKSVKNLRNPSSADFRFPKLGMGTEKSKNKLHAKMMIRASNLIFLVSQKTGISSQEWEAGLFMIGYSLNGVGK